MARILIVDDKEDNLYYLRMLLSGQGWTVEEARHGAEALVKARQEPPDLVVSDLLMPVMDGYTLLRHWKTDQRLARIPFVVYTATYTEEEDERLALKLGADAFLLKPTEPEIIVERLREVLARVSITAAKQPQSSGGKGEELMEVYSKTLVRKLEEKTLQLEEANRVLRRDISNRNTAEHEMAVLNRALRIMTACGEVLIRATDEMKLLENVCRLAVEIGGYRMTWVGYVEGDAEGTIKPKAHAGVEDGYLHKFTMNSLENDPRGQGPAGMAIRTGEARYVSDVHKVPSFFEWKSAALERDFRSVICLPLRHEKQVFGVLGLCSAQVHDVTVEELKLLQDMADELAFGIMNIRAWTARRRMNDAMLKVAASVSSHSRTEFFVDLTKNMIEALGAHSAFAARLLAGESHRAMTFAHVEQGLVMDDFEFSLAETPCMNLLQEDECMVQRKLRELYPQCPIGAAKGAKACAGRRLTSSSGELKGFLFVFFKEEFTDRDLVSSALQIFASRASAELEREEAFTQIIEQASLLDKAQDAILVRDLENKVSFWNKGCENLYGWTREEVLGKSIHAQIYKDPEEFLRAMELAMEHGEWLGEIQQQSKSGKELYVNGRWTLVRDDQGIPKGMLVINTDITEKKRIEAQFLRAQRMESIGTLAGGIAHDLNNVLSPILMSVQMLQSKVADEQGFAMLETVQSCTQRAADLVKQVLSFARGMEGKRIDVNLRHLGTDIQRIVQEAFPKNIEFAFSANRKLWSFLGDPTQLHQVLMNLCVNARDAMPQGGKLTVTMENIMLDEVYVGMYPGTNPGPYVSVEVLDSGTGIPEEIRDKIFEPFFTTKAQGVGTGLGLSTTAAIVRGHGGFINVYSELGGGTKFKVFIPADPASIVKDDEEPEQRRLPHGNGEGILIVDDEASIRTVAHRLLESFGYSILLADNGVEALALYAQRRSEVDLVLTDIAMPVMDGSALTIALKALNPQIKIIGSSGFATNENIARLSDQGVLYFLPKPYTTESLLQVIREALDATD